MNIVVYKMENKDNVFWRIMTEIKKISINQGMTIFSKECMEASRWNTHWRSVEVHEHTE